MTLLTVSNQGFTVHNHTCGINFLSHLRGAPQSARQSGMIWDDHRSSLRQSGMTGEGVPLEIG
jgi:hypothetical protein